MRSEHQEHPADHGWFQQRIDEMLVTGCGVEEERLLREHLESCEMCERYLETGRRAIASLDDFHFEVDPGLHAEISASLRVRAVQREAAPLRRRRWDWRRWVPICAMALLLTAAGSLLDLQLGGLLARLLDMKSLAVQRGVIGFWIVPSMYLVLLFPLLPLLSQTGTERTERSL